MFKHHKYCVIEVSGLLVAELLVADEGASGLLDVYLLDGAHESAYRSGDDRDVKNAGLPPGSDKSKRVKVTDTGLIEFVSRLMQRSGDERRFARRAQVAGTVDMDGGEAQLSYVSQAFIQDKEGLLKYEPQ